MSVYIEYRTRVAVARSLLQSGHAPVEEVMVAVGCTDASAFRRTFSRHAIEEEGVAAQRNSSASTLGEEAQDLLDVAKLDPLLRKKR